MNKQLLRIGLDLIVGFYILHSAAILNIAVALFSLFVNTPLKLASKYFPFPAFQLHLKMNDLKDILLRVVYLLIHRNTNQSII